MTTSILHFTIHGSFVTNFARSLWVEGEHEQALRVLRYMDGLPEESIHLILIGKKKLEGVDEFTLEDDNATEHDGCPLLSMEQILVKRKKDAAEVAYIEKARTSLVIGDTELVPSPFGQIELPRSWTVGQTRRTPAFRTIRMLDGETPADAWKRVEDLLPDQVDKARRATETEKAYREKSRPDAAAWLQQAKDADNRVPRPDLALEGLHGLILPNGRFYSCGYGDHLALASNLNLGHWQTAEASVVHVSAVCDRTSATMSTPMTELRKSDFMFPAKCTQKQVDTCFDWCVKHGRKMPPLEEMGLE